MSDLAPASEISTALDITIRAVSKRAKQEAWPYKKVQGRGKPRKEYEIEGLPGDVRTKVLASRAEAEIPEKPEWLLSAVRVEDETCQNLTAPQRQNALAKADLLRLYLQHLKKAPWGKKNRARKQFTTAYNSGLAYPKLFDILGEVHWKTLEGWKRTLRAEKDALLLADRRGVWKRGSRSLSEEQQRALLACACRPNKPMISEAIREARALMATKGIRNGHSDSTYRRWLEDWKAEHFHIWTFNREGKKAWNDKCAFYIERDYTVINVGDILVADGHVLNFEIINPWTGNPKRMTLIVWKDMKSSFPLGWEIMPTENTAAISSALRRAVLRLGMYPQVGYIDNGKAFAARFFNGADLEQEGFSGVFERLGIQPIFAWPYHGQSKTVERFFGTFAELERWCPTYTGTSIENKPPRMLRAEKLHRRVYEKATGGRGITLSQAHRAIAAWFDEYVQRPQRGHLEGKTPLEVFSEGKGPGVDRSELNFLMMSLEIRTIGRNGIKFLGKNFYHPDLYGRRHPVTIRYDLQNTDSILVFDRDGTLLCEAFHTEKAHPAASVLGTDEDREKLKELIAHKRWQEKEASVCARKFLEEEVLPEQRRMLERLGLSDDGSIKKEAPEKVIATADERQIMDQVRQIEQINADKADTPFAELDSLSEMDRYERLVELEVRGILIPKQWQAFMRYFEMTPEFERHRDYFEEHRTKTMLVYQTGEFHGAT